MPHWKFTAAGTFGSVNRAGRTVPQQRARLPPRSGSTAEAAARALAPPDPGQAAAVQAGTACFLACKQALLRGRRTLQGLDVHLPWIGAARQSQQVGATAAQRHMLTWRCGQSYTISLAGPLATRL